MSTSKDYKSNEAVDMEGKSEARGKWVKEENVLLASIIATQSLGNVWVLPYYCYIYGGGKIFLIYTDVHLPDLSRLFPASLPYRNGNLWPSLCLPRTCCRPILFHWWHDIACKILSSFKRFHFLLVCYSVFNHIYSGVGISSMVYVFFLNIYYCVILAWIFHYFFSTILSLPDLPWDTCGNKQFNT